MGKSNWTSSWISEKRFNKKSKLQIQRPERLRGAVRHEYQANGGQGEAGGVYSFNSNGDLLRNVHTRSLIKKIRRTDVVGN